MRLSVWMAVLVGVTAMTVAPAQAQKPAFVVFFQEWSAAIDTSAQEVINSAAEYAKTHPRAVAHVTGFADPTGSREANVLLSQLRAQVVADGLTAAGVPASHIRKAGRGAVRFSATPLESRRVEVRVGG